MSKLQCRCNLFEKAACFFLGKWSFSQALTQCAASTTAGDVTSAKALGGGLPIGALVTGERLADALGPGDHGSTFAGGLVACAAALVALEICSDTELLGRVRMLGERLRGGLETLPFVTEVRGRGLMVGVDLTDAIDGPELQRRALLEQRLVVNATGPGTIRLEPPLIVSEEEIDEAVGRLRALA